jgi:2-polyprenyl-3-methyl-5-hydroxy-6-metoxy-1,4-benzoquinol methylase
LAAKSTCQKYGWSSASEPHTAAYLLPTIIDILAGLKVGRIVDLGSGNGALCGTLKAAGYDVVGVEYDAPGVEIAAETYPNIPFYNLDVTEAPASFMDREAPFDVVISTEVIEHLFAPQGLVAFARDVMKPGGHLIISTPYHGYLKNLALSLANKWDTHHTPLWSGGHIKFWSRKTLSTLLQAEGFNVMEFHGTGRLPFLWKSMILVASKPE